MNGLTWAGLVLARPYVHTFINIQLDLWVVFCFLFFSSQPGLVKEM